MGEQKLYHWMSFLLPGSVFVICTAMLVDLSSERRMVTELLQNKELLSSASAAIGLFFVLCSYILGMLIWGFSYKYPRLCLWLTYYGWNRAVRNQKSERSGPGRNLLPHYRERIERFNSTTEGVSTIGLKDANVQTLPFDDSGYRCYQYWMVACVEKLGNYLGPRIAAQWEMIGLLLSLSLVFRLFVVLCLAAGVLCFSKGRNGIAWIFLAGALVFALLTWLCGISFRVRNRYLGRDVAYGHLLLRQIENTAEEGMGHGT